MEGLPGWVISPMPGPPPRQHKHERQYTPSTHSIIPIRRIWNDDNDGQMIFGDLVGLKFPDICLTGEEKPRKTSPRKPVPTGDRTRARCVISAHATTCSTAVDLWKCKNKFYPGPGIVLVSPALRSSTLPLSYPRQTPIHDRINFFFVDILFDVIQQRLSVWRPKRG